MHYDLGAYLHRNFIEQPGFAEYVFMVTCTLSIIVGIFYVCFWLVQKEAEMRANWDKMTIWEGLFIWMPLAFFAFFCYILYAVAIIITLGTIASKLERRFHKR